ncbi:hypothetical protein [Ensifer sp. LCM 4579]|uniref:hypothetical protein n=1 Tax=Ensifer sp. LCM 4579 TaxID=1848292 RepID=UPI0008DABA94|nr:hypothetical protein [Ensifer sp. LCM 4579]OHV81906.1 hypothetical protein LCM4579_19140 [Ensifer sp. LCM 4579]
MLKYRLKGSSGRKSFPHCCLAAAIACAVLGGVSSAQVPKREPPASFRITDRPPKPDPLPPEIQPGDESFVQIHGRWVDDPAQCPVGEPASPPVSSLLTDTLLRWQGKTCSVRDVTATEVDGELTALCVSEDGRSEYEFLLRRETPERMRIHLQDSAEEQVLIRCPR